MTKEYKLPPVEEVIRRAKEASVASGKKVEIRVTFDTGKVDIVPGEIAKSPPRHSAASGETPQTGARDTMDQTFESRTLPQTTHHQLVDGNPVDIVS